MSAVEPLRAAALRYAAAGWPVFPCKPGSKEPATTHGVKDATTDPDVIAMWWRSRAYNVAIATGSPGPDVLDVDMRPDGNGLAAFRPLRRAGLLAGACAIVRTRSGGLHVYYQGTGQGNGVLRRHHLDFRSSGGYVIAPPSWVEADAKGPAGWYEVVEKRAAAGRLDWAAVKQLLEPSRPRPATRAPQEDDDGARLIAWVASQPHGNHNASLYWAARRAVEQGLDIIDDLVAAAVQAGHAESRARRTVASAERAAR